MDASINSHKFFLAVWKLKKLAILNSTADILFFLQPIKGRSGVLIMNNPVGPSWSLLPIFRQSACMDHFEHFVGTLFGTYFIMLVSILRFFIS